MEPESRELAVYGTERLPITQSAAERIIARLWPKAGPVAAGHAMLLAVQENLNPLNHELYIVPFKNKDGSVSEVVVLGIEANRKMARRRTPYSYKDGPRPLTAQEMEDIGEDPKQKVGVICVLETPAGAVFPGYGFWPKGIEPYGSDKGNTKFNMASYRAERNALKRVMPDAELPAPVGMVIDGVYADVSEIIEAPKIAAPRTERPPAAPKPQDKPASTPAAHAPAAAPESPPAAPHDVPKGPRVVVDEDFLAMSDAEQANLCVEAVKEFGREKWKTLREELKLPAKTAIEMSAQERLTALKAIVERLPL